MHLLTGLDVPTSGSVKDEKSNIFEIDTIRGAARMWVLFFSSFFYRAI